MSDIRRLFPAYRWRWTVDHETGQRFDPYHVELTGRYGTVYLHGTSGGVRLQAWSDRRGVFARLLAIPDVTLHQKGEDEITVIFRPEQMPRVAELLRLHHRPKKKDAGGEA